MQFNEKFHNEIDQTPLVGRPRGPAWRALQADGIVWEGQVLIVGSDVDLASRLIVTQRRLAFVRGGVVTLELPRTWLRPAPVLRGHATVVLAISSPDAGPFAEPDSLAMRMRDGHPAAGHLIALLAGSGARRVLPDLPLARAEPLPLRALPPLPDRPRADPSPLFPAEAPEFALPAWPDPATERMLPAAVPDRRPAPAPAPAGTEPLVRPPSPPVAVGPDRDWNLRSVRDLAPKAQRKRRTWNLRFSGFVLLLLAATLIGTVGFPRSRDDDAPLQSATADQPSPTLTTPSPTPAPTATAETAETAGVQATAQVLGVGGGDVGSGQPVVSPAENLAPASVPAPPAAEPATAAGPAAERAPATTAAANSADLPAPAVLDPPTPANTAPTMETVAAAPPATAATPQVMAAGPFRLTVELAATGATLPKFGLAASDRGDWVALIVRVDNASDTAASLEMADFRLLSQPGGRSVPLDGRTDLVASIVGLDPATGDAGGVEIAPAQSRRLALVFVVPPATDRATLRHGTAALDLAPAFAAATATAIATAEAAPELAEARVLNVLDGTRIVVDLAGVETEVRYLGVRAPLADACFAADAAAFNAGVVEGQTVWLEQQTSDRDAEGRLLRDVWVEAADGSRTLVAARLVELGAALPALAAPDLRYAGWLEGTAATAQAAGAGLWSACPSEVASLPTVESEPVRLAFATPGLRTRPVSGPR